MSCDGSSWRRAHLAGFGGKKASWLPRRSLEHPFMQKKHQPEGSTRTSTRTELRARLTFRVFACKDAMGKGRNGRFKRQLSACS
jgi:hypothetical protein